MSDSLGEFKTDKAWPAALLASLCHEPKYTYIYIYIYTVCMFGDSCGSLSNLGT